MAYNQFPEHPDDSVGGWMLTFFLMGIPLVGFVYLLVLALGSGGSPAKRNFARSVPLADHHFRVGDHLLGHFWCGVVRIHAGLVRARHTRIRRGGIRITRVPPPLSKSG